MNATKMRLVCLLGAFLVGCTTMRIPSKHLSSEDFLRLKGPALALPLWVQAASTIRCQRDRKMFCRSGRIAEGFPINTTTQTHTRRQ